MAGRSGAVMGSDDAGRAIQSLREKYEVVHERVIKLEAKDEQRVAQISDICLQLKATDVRLTEHIDANKRDVLIDIKALKDALMPLIEDFHQRKGERRVASWVPSFLSTIVTVGSIVALIKFGLAP